MRYILALIPAKQDEQTYFEAAQGFAELCDGYLLNGNSLPHVTLVSFSNDHVIDEIWASAQTWETQSYTPRMLGLMLKKGQIPPHHFSVGVTLARDPPLLNLHHQAIDLLDRFGTLPLNPSRELYQPHLTLAGISWKPSSTVILPPIINDLLSRSLSPFRLALGRGDDIGQYLETLRLT